MADRPYVLIEAAMSLDGYLDDASEHRLLLSSPEDFARVDRRRAAVDAILVGAGTIRADNPRLLVRAPELRQRRLDRGESETPAKVVVSGGGELDPAAPFFTTGACDKIVYVPDAVAAGTRARLGGVADVVAAGDPLSLERLLADLHRRGVRRLMVEGGGTMHTQFLAQGLVDEVELSVAPFFVGDSRAPRFVGDASFPFGPGRRMRLAEAGRHGDCAYLRYLLTDAAPRADGAAAGYEVGPDGALRTDEAQA
ncbi:dihydrofolate reductase family protein [Catellatospora sp. KI3]|uniref:RibD family protein n=1 Tax=Catellatospora sp. KI3 TaxID=3041620 RepID=UPI002482725E|nr:dihydrofolate reductase family protein [Catellatospora sp. KI3]MDI1463894.1 dihydrofolate reductase family protein [Catellatospora sp. KI3]